MHLGDAEQAFDQSKMSEDIFIRLPQSCGSLSGKVVKLARSLYGLKQASRTWHYHLIGAIKCLGLEQCGAECLLCDASD